MLVIVMKVTKSDWDGSIQGKAKLILKELNMYGIFDYYYDPDAEHKFIVYFNGPAIAFYRSETIADEKNGVIADLIHAVFFAGIKEQCKTSEVAMVQLDETSRYQIFEEFVETGAHP